MTPCHNLVCSDWSWRSHGSLIPGKFDPKVNRPMKTSRQEDSAVAWSYSSAPGTAYVSGSVALLFGIKKQCSGNLTFCHFQDFYKAAAMRNPALNIAG